MAVRKSLASLLLLLVAFTSLVLGSPFYYFNEIPPQPAGEPVQQQVSQEQLVANANQQVSAGGEQLPKRIQGHLTQLYSHGSSAMKNVVDTVQPDLSNIGKDLTDVYQVTRDNVGKRIEPYANTVRPYLDHAQKVITPFVNQAREEVPKLITQAGPAIAHVGEQVIQQARPTVGKITEQVRDGISGVWNKLTQAAPNQQKVANFEAQPLAQAQQVVAGATNEATQVASQVNQEAASAAAAAASQ